MASASGSVRPWRAKKSAALWPPWPVVLPLATRAALVDKVEGADAGSFRTAMADALQDVSRSQLEAQRMQREFSLDKPTVSLEGTMVAMQKSQIGFQAAVQVRNRLLSAYTEIMNMQV